MNKSWFWNSVNKEISSLMTDVLCQDKFESKEEEVGAHIGAEILGPILFQMSNWIKVQSLEMEYLIFLSREGKVLYDTYIYLYPEEKKNCGYLYVSRKSLIVPRLKDVKSYEEIIEVLVPLLQDTTVDNLLCILSGEKSYDRKVGIEIDKGKDVFSLDDVEKSAIVNLVRDNKEYYENQYRLLSTYLHSSIPEGNVAIIDVGWQGTMQKEIETFFEETNFKGLYLGVRDKSNSIDFNSINRKGLFFEPGKNKKYDYMFRFATDIVELLFYAFEGSTKSYSAHDLSVKPVLDEEEYIDKDRHKLKTIRKYSLKACVCIKEYIESARQEVSIAETMKVFSKFAVTPKNRVIGYFSGMSYKYTKSEPLLPDRSLLYYCVNSRELKQFLQRSGCKVFVLKKLFKVPLPYFAILCCLSKTVDIRGKQYMYLDGKKNV